MSDELGGPHERQRGGDGTATSSSQEPSTGAAPPRGSSARTDRREARLGAAVVVVAVLAVGAACWRSARRWLPTTDWALIELQVRDLWVAPPLLGAPSAVGFHHPGPAPYVALAPLYRLFGADPQGLALAAGALACASVAAVAVTAWRRGGLVALLVATAAMVWLAGSLPPGTLVDPWNPWLAVLPFAWLLVLVWSVLDDDLAALPLAALAGSFVVQCHVAYLVPVVALAALVVVVLVRRGLRTRRAAGAAAVAWRRRLWRAGGLAVVVLAVAWAAPVLEQVTSTEGNLTRGLDYAVGGEATDRLPVGDAVGVMATELGWPGPWLTGDEPVEQLALQVLPSSRLRLVVPLAALVGAVWLARRDASARHLLAVVAVAAATSMLAIAQLEVGRVFAYAARFAWVAAAMVWVAVVLTALRWALCRRPDLRRWAVGVGLVVVAVAGARVVVRAGDAAVPVYSPDGRAIEVACLQQLLPDVRQAVGEGPVHVRLAEFWPVMAASILNELDRDGVAWAVDERFGFHVERDGREPLPGEVALVVAQDSLADEWARTPGVVEVAHCDLLDADERAELARLEAKEDPSQLDLVMLFDLTKRAERTVVFVDQRG